MALNLASGGPSKDSSGQGRPALCGLAPLGQPAPAQPSEPAQDREQPAPAAPERLRSSLPWLRTVSFRARVSFLVAVAVGFAVVLAAAVAYVAVSRQLEGQVNTNLSNAVDTVSTRLVQIQPQLFGNGGVLDPRPFLNFQLETGDPVQVLLNGQAYSVQSPGVLAAGRFFPVTAPAKAVYTSGPASSVPLENLTGADGNSYRVATVGVIKGSLAVQIGYELSDMDHTLAYLRLVLVLVAIGGIALAAGIGWAVGRASIRPVEHLTLAAEHVTATQDLSASIDDEGNDELARLARTFNAMLQALAASRHQQAQLVVDAGHELRTPLTSLRTNIEVLMRARELPDADHRALLADVKAQLGELTTLVGDLVDLSREEEQQPEPESVPFDQIVEHAVERAKRRAGSLHFDVSLQPGPVRAQPALLERAVLNVLDNAAKWSPPGGRVGVTLAANGSWHLTVTDEGPGVAAEDLPHIFDRFYRAQSARSMPGSGLGLAIVRQVVASHGGNVSISSPPSGGTQVDLVLPLDHDGGGGPGEL